MLLELDAASPLPATVTKIPADSAAPISPDDLRRALAGKARALWAGDERLALAEELAAAMACALRPCLAPTALPTEPDVPATPSPDPTAEVLVDGRLGAGVMRFCAAPAVFTLSAVEMLLPAAAPVCPHHWHFFHVKACLKKHALTSKAACMQQLPRQHHDQLV